MSHEKFVIECINFEDENQKKKNQFTTSIKKVDANGKVSDIVEETDWMHHRYPGFANAKYFTPDKRDFIQIDFYPEQDTCTSLSKQIQKYDDAIEKNMESFLGKFHKLYNPVKNFKTPRVDDEDFDEDKKKTPRNPYFKMRLFKKWNYYFKESGEAVDEDNSKLIIKAVTEALNTAKDKAKAFDNLTFILNVKNDNGKIEKKKFNYHEDIDARHEIATNVYYTKATGNVESSKKPWDCDEDELSRIYGNFDKVDVRSPEDLDKYYKPNCYVRFMFMPDKVWAAKSKDENGKRKLGVKFICYNMQIIQIPLGNSDGTMRSQYQNYTFGKKPVVAGSAKSEPETKEKEKEVKSSKKVIVNSDSGSGSGSEDGNSGSENESESEEEEVSSKNKKVVKAVDKKAPVVSKRK